MSITLLIPGMVLFLTSGSAIDTTAGIRLSQQQRATIVWTGVAIQHTYAQRIEESVYARYLSEVIRTHKDVSAAARVIERSREHASRELSRLGRVTEGERLEAAIRALQFQLVDPAALASAKAAVSEALRPATLRKRPVVERISKAGTVSLPSRAPDLDEFVRKSWAAVATEALSKGKTEGVNSIFSPSIGAVLSPDPEIILNKAGVFAAKHEALLKAITSHDLAGIDASAKSVVSIAKDANQLLAKVSAISKAGQNLSVAVDDVATVAATVSMLDAVSALVGGEVGQDLRRGVEIGQSGIKIVKAVGSILSSSANADGSISLFNLGAGLASGNLAGAVSGLFAAFGTGAQPDPALMNEIRNTQKLVEELHTDMTRRFDAVDDRLDSIQASINKNFRLVHNDLAAIKRELRYVEGQLTAVSSQLFKMEDNLVQRLDHVYMHDDDAALYNCEQAKLFKNISHKELANCFGILARQSADSSPNMTGGVSEQPLREALSGSLEKKTNTILHALSAHTPHLATGPEVDPFVWAFIAERALRLAEIRSAQIEAAGDSIDLREFFVAIERHGRMAAASVHSIVSTPSETTDLPDEAPFNAALAAYDRVMSRIIQLVDSVDRKFVEDAQVPDRKHVIRAVLDGTYCGEPDCRGGYSVPREISSRIPEVYWRAQELQLGKVVFRLTSGITDSVFKDLRCVSQETGRDNDGPCVMWHHTMHAHAVANVRAYFAVSDSGTRYYPISRSVASTQGKRKLVGSCERICPTPSDFAGKHWRDLNGRFVTELATDEQQGRADVQGMILRRVTGMRAQAYKAVTTYLEDSKNGRLREVLGELDDRRALIAAMMELTMPRAMLSSDSLRSTLYGKSKLLDSKTLFRLAGIQATYNLRPIGIPSSARDRPAVWLADQHSTRIKGLRAALQSQFARIQIRGSAETPPVVSAALHKLQARIGPNL